MLHVLLKKIDNTKFKSLENNKLYSVMGKFGLLYDKIILTECSFELTEQKDPIPKISDISDKEANKDFNTNANVADKSSDGVIKCDDDSMNCDADGLCSIATYSLLVKVNWTVGQYEKFRNTAKQRNLSCGVGD